MMPENLTELTSIIVNLSIILGLSMAAVFTCQRILNRLTLRFEKTPSHWDDTLTHAARPIVMTGIVLMALSVSIDVLVTFFEVKPVTFDINTTLQTARQFLVIVLLYALIIRYLRLVRTSFHNPQRTPLRVDAATAELILKLLELSLSIATGLTLLQNIGVSISGLLAFGGVGGLAVGLAAKDMLANLFGGLTLHLDRPFIIGEKVLLKDKGIEGFVEHIGWRQTRIRGYDRTPIYVPNALFTNMAVINPSRMQNRRIDTVLGLRYRDLSLLDTITTAIEQYLLNHQELDQQRGVLARFTDYGESSLDIKVRFYTVSTNWNSYMKTRHEILLEIGRIIHHHGADMAFPTQTLDLYGDTVTLERFSDRADDEAKPD